MRPATYFNKARHSFSEEFDPLVEYRQRKIQGPGADVSQSVKMR
jgi:hypothetical protein